jgi:hypothetical protein
LGRGGRIGGLHEREPRSVEMAEVDYAPLFPPARARSVGIFAAVHGRRAAARVLPPHGSGPVKQVALAFGGPVFGQRKWPDFTRPKIWDPKILIY